MAIRPGPLLAAAGGLLLIYSGIKHKKVTSALRDVISGQSPTEALNANVIQGTSLKDIPGNPQTGTGPHADVANAALAYRGHCYIFGGAPGRNGAHCWDCSSFVNYVVGVQLGLPIPGYGAGKYDGTVHGPPTGLWLLWPGVTRIARNQVQAGDIMVWQTHMGIAINNSEMISAQDPALGTGVSNIAGPPGEVLFPKRLRNG